MPSLPNPDALVVREVPAAEHEAVVPLLLLAELSERALRWSLANLSDVVYRANLDGALVAAATMRWRDDPCELVELAVAEAAHGRGVGRAVVAWLLEEARRREKSAMLVGTANSSIGNLAFYQKCGFRMDHVRKDYFWYDRSGRSEHGIPTLDLLVFRYDL
ncbi:GNAT family N-acetyltransferase [Roseisolibacter sp. H3M3-2]|uniref:GNAT family N-acetyltransferase n=1 Tax=Roseisolibacter sp. H3M3-2 TaxID=3031323 RepID=UPI0023DBF315|nr:GNAT family N-acetyltransferase [Roseisolibacter sp. H3M3-2]MDF1504677.1 GNAT family N-acetyltransferase [Roseisolibacter sp. H3M3-2]